MKHRLVVLLLLTLLPMRVLAQGPIDPMLPMGDQVELYRAKVLMLERELRFAKAEVQMLKAEVARLKGASPGGAAPAQAPSTPTPAAPAATTPGASTDEANKPIRAVFDLIKEIPKDLRNVGGNWGDPAVRSKAAAWVVKTGQGRTLQGTLRVASAKVEPNPAHAKDKSQPKYILMLTFKPESAVHWGVRFSQGVQGRGDWGIGVPGNQEAIKLSEQIRPNHYAEIRGVIDEIRVNQMGVEGGKFTLHLRDYNVSVLVPPPQ